MLLHSALLHAGYLMIVMV